MTKRKIDLGAADDGGLTHNPFSALGGRDAPARRSAGAESAKPRAQADRPPSPAGQGAHLLVRKERKGRGGKVVTIVSALSAPESVNLVETAKSLGQRLGTGARVKGDAIVVQGELSERVRVLLEGDGMRVTVGS